MKSSPTSVVLENSLLAYFTPIIASSCHWLISSLELNFTIFPLAYVVGLAVFIRGLSKGRWGIVLLLRVVRVCCSCYCCGLSEFVVPAIIAGCHRAWLVLLLRVVIESGSCYC